MLRLNLYGRFALRNERGVEIPVTARKAQALLAYLAMPPGKTRSREAIMALLWSERAEAQARGSLRQVLAGLRKTLGPAFEDVLTVDKDTVTLNPVAVTVLPATGEPFLDGLYINDPSFEDWVRDARMRESGPAKTDAEPGDCPFPDIAILPFETMSKAAEDTLFADGITEDLLAVLSRFKSLTVYSPWSSFHYDDSKTTEEIALELEIDYVLEGSVRRAGNRLRITAMLFDVETVTHVWVQRYDRDLGDEFAIQDEVTRDVATRVAAQLEMDAYQGAAQKRAGALSAYDYVLLGEHAQSRNWSTREAVAFYDKAIALDPQCARAYANLANWHANSHQTLFVPVAEARTRTRELGETALEASTGDALVLATLADAYSVVGDYDLARQCLEKALRLNPNDQNVMAFAASTLRWLGEVDEALIWLERYLSGDPVWQTSAMELSLEIYYLAGEYEAALASVARLRDLPLDLLPIAAAAHAQCGRLEEATVLRERYEAQLPAGQSFEQYLGRTIGRSFKPEQAAIWWEGFRKAGFVLSE